MERLYSFCYRYKMRSETTFVSLGFWRPFALYSLLSCPPNMYTKELTPKMVEMVAAHFESAFCICVCVGSIAATNVSSLLNEPRQESCFVNKTVKQVQPGIIIIFFLIVSKFTRILSKESKCCNPGCNITSKFLFFP